MRDVDFKAIFDKRVRILCVFFVFFALLCLGALFYQLTFKRELLLAQINSMALRRCEIVPLRGRIIATDGRVLAWSERTFNLHMLKRSDAVSEVLRKSFSSVLTLSEKTKFPVVIYANVRPDDLEAVVRLCEKHRCLRLESGMKRHVCEVPALRELVGKVEYGKRGMLYGISGMEKKYDRRLRGRNSVYEVVLDKDGCWIDDTVKIIDPGCRGEDVKIEIGTERGNEYKK